MTLEQSAAYLRAEGYTIDGRTEREVRLQVIFALLDLYTCEGGR